MMGVATAMMRAAAMIVVAASMIGVAASPSGQAVSPGLAGHALTPRVGPGRSGPATTPVTAPEAPPARPCPHSKWRRTPRPHRNLQHGGAHCGGDTDASPDASMATSRSEDEESLAGPKRGPATPAGTVPKRRSSSRPGRVSRTNRTRPHPTGRSRPLRTRHNPGDTDASPDASMATSRSEDEESLAGPKRGPATPAGTVPKRRSSSSVTKGQEGTERRWGRGEGTERGHQGPPPALPKRLKKSKPSPAPRDLGRWKPADDLLLINAVLQTNDLTSVHLGVKFSCRFTLREIQERWYSLLYDPVICKHSCQAMRQLHPEAVAAIQSKVLFSKAEEQLLTRVPSSPVPSLDTFQELLQAVLPCQDLSPDLTVADRRQKREIRQLEQELHRWQVLVDSITGGPRPS
ncbi:microspherule protein 1, partial [Pyrgilauda ruficollis]|uniref:microspherule protein 1 n=1 Tax=Pyrgilauda ruficollis TaxID=221976 RepID=UPI001B87C17B